MTDQKRREDLGIIHGWINAKLRKPELSVQRGLYGLDSVPVHAKSKILGEILAYRHKYGGKNPYWADLASERKVSNITHWMPLSHKYKWDTKGEWPRMFRVWKDS